MYLNGIKLAQSQMPHGELPLQVKVRNLDSWTRRHRQSMFSLLTICSSIYWRSLLLSVFAGPYGRLPAKSDKWTRGTPAEAVQILVGQEHGGEPRHQRLRHT